MHVKVNLRIAEGIKTPGRRGLIYESWRIGHDKPISLSKLLVDVAVLIGEFWLEIGCGSREDGNAELQKAAAKLAVMKWREAEEDADGE